MEETSVDCDLALVIHCASLVTRSENIPLASFPGLSQQLGNEATVHNEASGEAVLFSLLHITYFHFQGNGDSFKLQSIYKGILSARCNVFTCMMIMLLSISSVCSVSYW